MSRYAKLQALYLDREMFDEVKKYFAEHIESEALKRLFEFEDVAGYAQAKQIIEGAFDQMEATFAPQKPEKKPVDNPAR